MPDDLVAPYLTMLAVVGLYGLVVWCVTLVAALFVRRRGLK